MTTQTEALKLALEALELTVSPSPSVAEIKAQAWRVGKEALMSVSDGAQPAVPQVHKQSTTCGEPTNLERHERNVQKFLGTPQPKEPEQEPVAWGVIASNTGKMCQVELDYDEVSDINSKWLVPLYTTPPPVTESHKRKPLTDEQTAIIYKAWQAVGADLRGLSWGDFVKELGLQEDAHGIVGETHE